MQVNAAPRPPGFAHALVHADDTAELVRRVAPVAAAADRDTGAQIALAVSPEAERALREELADCTGGVGRLTTLTRSARESGQTVAAWRARELRALSSSGRPVFVVAQHDPDLDGIDGGFWIELEAALNISLDGLAVTQLCVYPRIPLYGAVGDAALANHPLLLHAEQFAANPAFRSPAEVLAALPFAPPHLLGPPDIQLQYNTFELSRVRDAVEAAARACRFDQVRGEDMVQAVNEVATNAVEHGSPEAGLSIWTRPGELVCEVHDTGSLPLSLIGLTPPHPSRPRGRGTWIARQLCDSLHVWRADDGTRVRLLVRA
ncbi:ATP-binding protein [Pseudonocardia sp. NPDC049635]|uniref:ATP-binding protein n=1 Tax=Pseudonocardia sp. NPDC049635 TaxID=3155506 RepID=UPI0033DD14AD